jgi:hypothetical protein
VRPWIELEPLVRVGDGPYPIPVKDAEVSLLADARSLVSGMVYGWTFDYIPGDSARRVTESFTLAPVALVPQGTPRLRVLETEQDATRLWARFVYTLDPAEASRRSAWDANTALLSTGRGTARAIDGPKARTAALADAIRDAIRRALNTRWVNKPREVTGDVVLWEDPSVLVRAGVYDASATVKLVVRELTAYRIF